jgi:hypothetical protein
MPLDPGSGADGTLSTISQDSDEARAIDDKLAGSILNIPFELVHIFEEASPPLSEDELERMAGPFNIWLEENGFSHLKRSEVILFFWLSIAVTSRAKIIKKARAERAAKNAPNDSRPKGDGKNVPGVVDGSPVEGSPRPDPGL